MEITKVVKSFIRRGWSNTFENIVYMSVVEMPIWLFSFNQ